MQNALDVTGEVRASELTASKLTSTCDAARLKDCDFYIVAVPTPVDSANKPDFPPLLSASKTVGRVLKRGVIVVYESTVYPGATEEECVRVLERESGLKYGVDFFCGYSPERIPAAYRERVGYTGFEFADERVSGGSGPTAHRRYTA